ncbi:hypothetical protein AZI87_03025 [Bdellovibrio bacteriovorus]|uniref:YkuD domain-containing protein n=1 Tax=Bdellovibrio bacteriovorus TaxID=959 RepID=A0A162GIP1_BDEBC|nr:murein L,D-transpeptidase catalytic domain family protein [Bdellovibrio bacteriovorus]KYG68245.1 hypothetical protein AZI87_03025 [Bdellovibrio bacteriovorus]
MKNSLRFIAVFLFIIFLTGVSLAESLFERRIADGRKVFDVFLQQGIPQEALDLTFRMFDYNVGLIPNTEYAVIVNYSEPSTVKRLYLLHLDYGYVERFYVAHGINSGVLEARSFSNYVDSWKSSLGFYFAQGTYLSKVNGRSLYLEGIDKSNDRAKERAIVLHGAGYVSEAFIAQNGRLGWSEGCFAVSLQDRDYLIDVLQSGSLLLSYHKDLMRSSRLSPWQQELAGSEIIPPGVNPRRTSGEGGGGR